ncbi:MAG: serine/threonine protein kinase, partial [Coriobacteriales bacterium]|nr:serine/threonine protein kinase [Coriobacteriales bacterium]
MDDVAAFLSSYKHTLVKQVAEGVFPPEYLEAYEFESCLKHHGGKEVYLVRDRRTQGHAILRVTDGTKGAGAERADAEYAILSKLDHPGIPKVYGATSLGSRSFLVREYFDGEPLDVIASHSALSTAAIYDIAQWLCVILSYLHAKTPPVIHRDIKPQNIIICPDGSVGLTDFGIARTYRPEATSDTEYAGTLPYAPPEQFGYAQSTPLTDIYALGIVLVYLATGSPLRQDLPGRIKDGQLRLLIEKCIAFDPADRFQDAGQVLRRIKFIKRVRHIRSVRSRSRRLVLRIATGALVAAVVVSGGTLFAANGGFEALGRAVSGAGAETGGAGGAG